jgi:hypothetical protein
MIDRELDRDLALGAAAECKRLADEQAFPNSASGTRVNIALANHYALQGILRLLRYQVESDDSVRIPLGSIAPSPRPEHQFVKVPVELLSSVAQSLVTLPNRHELSVDFHQRNGHGTAYIMRTEPNGYTIALSKFDWETP